jgi:hypothetical protein
MTMTHSATVLVAFATRELVPVKTSAGR